jgi:hypothetical protein
MRCWYVVDQPPEIEALQSLGIVIEQKNVSNVIANNDKAKILGCFADYMKGMRYRIRTIDRYTECLRIFFDYCQSENYLEIDNNNIADFNKNYILAKRLRKIIV